MSDKFFGKLLRQYEILEAELPQQNKMNERRQSLQQGAQPPAAAPAAAPAQQPGFFGRMKNYVGGEFGRSAATIPGKLGVPLGGIYNYFNGNRAKSNELDAKMKAQNTANRTKYADSNQYIQDTSTIYEKDKQKALQDATKKYDDMIKKNNEKLKQRQNQPAATPPAPVAGAKVPAPAANPQASMAAAPTPAPAARPQVPAPTRPAYRTQSQAPVVPQVNAATQRVDQMRADAIARNKAMAAANRTR